MKYLIASLVFIATVCSPAAAIDSEPILRAFDTDSGAEFQLLETEKGNLLLLVDGKPMAELAPDSMTMPSRLNPKGNGYTEVEWTYTPKKAEREVEWTYSPKNTDRIEFEY